MCAVKEVCRALRGRESVTGARGWNVARCLSRHYSEPVLVVVELDVDVEGEDTRRR